MDKDIRINVESNREYDLSRPLHIRFILKKPYEKIRLKEIKAYIDDGDGNVIQLQLPNDIKAIEIFSPTREYDEYINSKEWQVRRENFYSKHGKVCRCCGSTENIDLHHLNYNRLGYEEDEDLVPLCRDCHGVIHTFKDRYETNEGELLSNTWVQCYSERGRRYPEFMEEKKDHLEYLLKDIKDWPGKYKMKFIAVLRASVATRIPVEIFGKLIQTRKK